MAYDFCGLDFGTSNSTIGIYNGKEIQMVHLEDQKPILRSAIFFNDEQGGSLIGNRGVQEYLSGTAGRLMMSLKSVLGSTLMEERTFVQGRWLKYTEILGYLLRYIKEQAEKETGVELTRVVMGRPVRFHDHDDKRDRLAEKTLLAVAKEQGFQQVLFQYEPIAAALAYEESLEKEELAFIVDLGGGTSDFTIIRLGHRHKNTTEKRSEDILANLGIHIGGTDFDRLFSLRSVMPIFGLGGEMQGLSGLIQIPSSIYHDLTTWHTINGLYTHETKRALKSIWNHALAQKPIERLMRVIEKQQGHQILSRVEQGKCLLSNVDNISMDFSFVEKDFLIPVQRKEFEEAISEKGENLLDTVKHAVKVAGIRNQDIDSLFFTGGSTQIPLIRHSIQGLFPNAKCVQGNVFESVGKGLSIDAKRKFLG